MAERTDRPILSGVLALVAVGLGVGLILGLGALLVTRMAGVGGGAGDTADGGGASMYLPPAEKTDSPQPSQPGNNGKQSGQPSQSEEAQPTIVLNAGQSAVAPMQQIDLSGNYPGGDGAILQVQRFESGKWIDFPVTASVSNASFTTYVQTGQGGVNKFRMFDADADEASNAVKVRVG